MINYTMLLKGNYIRSIPYYIKQPCLFAVSLLVLEVHPAAKNIQNSSELKKYLILPLAF